LDLHSCTSCGKEGNTITKQEEGRRVATREPKGFIGSSKARTKATTTTVATSDLILNRSTTKAAITIAAEEAIDTTPRALYSHLATNLPWERKQAKRN